MKRKLKTITAVCAVLVGCTIFSAVLGADDRNQIGLFNLGGLLFKDKVKIVALKDPKVENVVCHLASVSKSLSFSDPSNSSIACRAIGKVRITGEIERGEKGEIVFSERQSLVFKKLNLRRIFDKANRTLVYVSYTTKAIEGSYKVSISTVVME